MEAHCEGDQGPSRAVMPRKKKKKNAGGGEDVVGNAIVVKNTWNRYTSFSLNCTNNCSW
jgi:hypothetical protein